MAVSVAKTLHPLPFENLEPKRFEDLVRQLIYDFRRWRLIEATGRAGSDDGFDVRAYEIMAGTEEADIDEEEEEGRELRAPPAYDRLWLIQCKRERAIGPSKIVAHLEVMPAESFRDTYGVIVAAACDFSKATRDVCREWCREKGVQEIHLWGKAEIEDQLYQPKNDNLLFAYFGVSLQVRRQAQATQLRRTTTLKRRIKRHLSEGGWPGQLVLIRDPSDDRYPDTKGKCLTEGGFLWRPYYSLGLGVHGLRVLVRCFHGYINHATDQWDIASALDRSVPNELSNLWRVSPGPNESWPVIEKWSQLPRGNQYFLKFITWLPYAEIIEIDEVGDDELEVPTVFARFKNGKPPFITWGQIVWEASSGYGGAHWDRDRHIRIFDDELRDAEWENQWAAQNGFELAREKSPFPASEVINRVAQDE